MAADTDSEARQWLAARVSGARSAIAGAVAAGCVEGMAIIAQAGVVAWTAGRLADGRGVPIAGAAIALLLAVLLRAVGQWGRRAAALPAAARLRQRIRDQLLEQLVRLGPVHLQGMHSASIASRVVEQVESLANYVAHYLPQRILAAVVPTGILVAVAITDWLAALLLLATAPLIPLFMALVGMGAEALNRRQLQQLNRLAGVFLDRVRGLTTLQLFGATDRGAGDVAAAADSYRRRSMGTLRVAFLSSAVLEFFSSVAIAVVAIYVGFALLGYFTIGPAAAMDLTSGLFVLLLAPEFFQPLRSLSEHYHDRAAALGAAAGLCELVGENVPAPGPRQQASRPGAVIVTDVSAAYPGSGAIFSALSFRLQVGECLLVHGRSGCGKSTLLYLLAGFLEPAGGRIAVGAERTAWIGQRPFLMAGTIAENIRLGAAGWVPDAAVRDAARRAGVLAFADSLPDGLATPLGERGTGLSGGEAQRVALARVFLSAAPIVLLDEPTEALDAVSERHVIAGLHLLRRAGCTLIIASHRDSLVGLADCVIAMDEVGAAKR